MPSAWVCPVCGRRVPGYATACHCGTGRPAEPTAEQLASAARALEAATRPGAPTFKVPFDARTVPWQVWAGFGGGAFVLLVGLLVGLWLGPPIETIPLLGYADRMPPSASPELLPDPTPTPTPFKRALPQSAVPSEATPAISEPLPTAVPTPLPTPNPDADA